MIQRVVSKRHGKSKLTTLRCKVVLVCNYLEVVGIHGYARTLEKTSIIFFLRV